jgi:hypothetical protein
MGVEPSRERVHPRLERVEPRVHPSDERVEPSIDVIEAGIDAVESSVGSSSERIDPTAEAIDPGAQIEQCPEGGRCKQADRGPHGSIHLVVSVAPANDNEADYCQFTNCGSETLP